jgi:hypothetical protein
VARIVRTTLAGWKRYKDHPDSRIQRRYAWEARELGTAFSAAIKAMVLYYRKNPTMRTKMAVILKDLYREFGFKSRLFAAVGARYVLWKIRREEKRLTKGGTFEPPMFYEKNYAFGDKIGPELCHFVTPKVTPPTPPAPADEQRELIAVG